MNTIIHTSPEERRSFWQAHVNALAGCGLSRREYCRRHQLAYHSLTYWVRKRAANNDVVQLSLVEVALPHRPPLHPGGSAFRLHLQCGLLEIDADFDQVVLHRLLAVLEQRCSL